MSKNLEKINVPDSLKKVKNIIGVFSAKGGVGKSAVSLNLALSLQEKGLKVGMADADIYGPSQTILMHASNQQVEVKDQKFLQPVNKSGIKFMSMGLISNDKMPVIWRGPMVSGAVLQLISQTNWQELDYLIVDTPPGTGDVQLTLLQKIPLKGALIITTPEDVSAWYKKYPNPNVPVLADEYKFMYGWVKPTAFPCILLVDENMKLIYLNIYLFG